MAQHTIDIHQPLIDRCRRGDRKAQYELYEMYAKAMYNVSMRIVNHVGEAEDILQESFIDAFTAIGNYRGDSSFGAWLKRIVINKSVSSLRKRRLQLLENIPDTPNEVIDSGEPRWDVKKVHTAIQELPDGYRLVLSLYLLEGYDHSEIAQILNITESTSKSQYNRAKNKLRTLLKQ